MRRTISRASRSSSGFGPENSRACECVAPIPHVYLASRKRTTKKRIKTPDNSLQDAFVNARTTLPVRDACGCGHHAGSDPKKVRGCRSVKHTTTYHTHFLAKAKKPAGRRHLLDPASSSPRKRATGSMHGREAACCPSHHTGARATGPYAGPHRVFADAVMDVLVWCGRWVFVVREKRRRRR